MTAVQQSGPRSGTLDRPGGAGLAEVVEIILDKGLVIDAYVRVSLVGIELITIDARIVIASVDTYLRFAEAVGRLNIAESSGGKGLPEFVGDMQESGAQKKVKGATRGALDTAKEKVHEIVGGDGDDADEEEASADRRGRSRSRERER